MHDASIQAYLSGEVREWAEIAKSMQTFEELVFPDKKENSKKITSQKEPDYY